MLNSASLKLDSYFYTDINVSVDMEIFKDLNSITLTTENLNADFIVHEDSETNGCIILGLTIETDSAADLALTISISVIGKFDVGDELLEKIKLKKVKEEVVISNALSILYTAIRDQVYSLTAKTPIGPQFLPTCNFRVEKNNDEVQEEESEKPASVRKKQK